jgi:hypothetical protein
MSLRRRRRGQLGEMDLPVGAGHERPIDYTAVKGTMSFQRAAEALQEKDHRPQPPARAAVALVQPRFDQP